MKLQSSERSSSLSIDSRSILLELMNHEYPALRSLPPSWEKCLDLKSGLVYFKNRTTGDRSFTGPLQSLAHKVWEEKSLKLTVDLELSLGGSQTVRRMKRRSRALDQDLDLRLGQSPSELLAAAKSVPAAPSSPPDHVSNSSSSSSQCSSTTHISGAVVEAESRKAKRVRTKEEPVMVTVGCRNCLMYIMLCRDNPRCPRCGNKVELDSVTRCLDNSVGRSAAGDNQTIYPFVQ